MLKLDWNLLWTIINVLVLFLLLRKFLFNPVCKIMDERAEKIQQDMDSASKTKLEAEQIKLNYEKEIANAHNEAIEITKKAKVQVNHECDLMLENAKQESNKIILEAEKTIAYEKAKAIDDAKSEIANLVILTTSKVVNKNVQNEIDENEVNCFLAEVGASK